MTHPEAVVVDTRNGFTLVHGMDGTPLTLSSAQELAEQANIIREPENQTYRVFKLVAVDEPGTPDTSAKARIRERAAAFADDAKRFQEAAAGHTAPIIDGYDAHWADVFQAVANELLGVSDEI